MFSGIDLFILVLIAVSVAISAIRGFFKEAVSLATWVAAVLITLMFTSRFASLLPRDTIESPQARYAISALLLFFGSMILGSLINYLFQKILIASDRSKLDLWLGIGFGAARGVVIVTLLVLLAHLIPTFKQESWWRQSAFIPPVQRAAKFIHAQLPRELAQHFDFSAASS